jgi:Tfp pilus assembly protein PilO
MKLPKAYFENISASKYREYLKLLPDVHKENTRLFFTLTLTFVALSFFGIFAINPTLSTIVDLKKQLADSEIVEKQISTKITNLSQLQQKYTQLNQDLPVIYEAIPEQASIPTMSAQIQALAQSNGLTLTSFRISEVQLTSQKKIGGSSFTFSLEAKGAYDKMLSFSTSLPQLSRLMTIESMSIARDPQQDALVLSIRGKAYFKN